VFELANVRYIEGAPMDWRRVLKPGVPVRLQFVEQGLAILKEEDNFGITWDTISYLRARGPDVPEHRRLYRPRYWPRQFHYLAWLNEPKESYCWLAIGMAESGSEIIFEVEQMLRPELEEILSAHSG
jgi:hypothetical protein